MTYRTAERIVTWALLATAACGGDNTGPSAPTCSSALASQLTLAIGAYALIDPASDGGCVVFPANASTVDSAEYLLVPQSAAPSFGASSPFSLRAVTLGAAPMRLAQTLSPRAGPATPAVQFDGLLRRLGSEHAARAGAAASRPLPGAPRLLPPPHPRRWAASASSRCAPTRRAAAHPLTSRRSVPGSAQSGRTSRSTSIPSRRRPGST